MDRNTQTEIWKLKAGDRFYKAGDKKKEVWEKVAHDSKVTNYQTYTQFAKQGNEKFPQAFKSDTLVIFLRNAIDQTQKTTI